MNIIEPRVLKGFRDFPPSAEIERRGLIEKIEASFRSFGFAPIDTPTLEYTEILLGKGGGETEKQVYRFTDIRPIRETQFLAEIETASYRAPLQPQARRSS
jgi:histidyl-tRNA synthetase